jgi:hypothetical protein
LNVSDQPDHPPIIFSEAAQAVRRNVLEMMRGHELMARGAIEAMENPICTLRIIQAALVGFAGSLELTSASLNLIDDLSHMPLADVGFEMMLGAINETGESNRG